MDPGRGNAGGLKLSAANRGRAAHFFHRQDRTTLYSPRHFTQSLGLVGAALVTAFGCTAQASKTTAPPAIKARIVAVEKRDLRRDVSSVGSLFAFDEVAVSSEIEGRVDRVFVDLGDRVNAGQALVQVSPIELGLARDQQQASLQATRAKLGMTDGADDVPDPTKAAEAQRGAADLSDAESKYKRAKSLFDDGLVPKGTLDEAEAKFHSARAAYDIEYEFPFGWNEIEGIHNRGDFDLGRHQEYSGKKLEYFDQAANERYLPNIVETSAGADRVTLTLLVDAYREEEVEGETRVVLGFHPGVAPI